MTVDYYIRQLLYRNDCVIIPAFGAFLVKRVTAKVSVENNYIEAPKRVLSFNPQLKNDDGLLITYVSEAQKISYKEAQLMVENFVEEVTAAIQRKKEVLVEDLGKFSFNENQFLSFEAITTQNYLLSSFGLENTSIEKITIENTAETQQEPKVIVLSDSIEENNKSFGWVKYAAVIAGLISMGGLFTWQHQQKEFEQQKQLVNQRVEEKIENHLQEANFSISPFTSSIEIEIPKEELHYPFHIIGGAFRSAANAAKKVNQLKQLGFDAKEIGQNKYGLYQVVYQSYITREEALQALSNIRQTHNPNAWLLAE